MSYIRKEFEAMVRATWGNTYGFMKDPYGHYCDDVLAGMWWMFQQNERAGQAVSVPQQWRDTMAELAADLESEIENRRSGDLDRRIERDLIVVREARALLAAQEQGHE